MDSADGEGQSTARPWYRKKRYLLPIGALVALMFISGLADEEDELEVPDEGQDASATDDEVQGGSAPSDSSENGPGGAVDPQPQPPDDAASQGGDDEPQDDDDGAERPTISDDAIAEAERFMAEETLVEDVSIEVDGDEVTISLIVNSAITDDAARQLLDNATRYLAAQVAFTDDSLDGPSNEHLGDVWDHYTLQVLAGTGPNSVRVQGAKVPASPRISW